MNQNAQGTRHQDLPKISRKLQGYFVNNHHVEVMERTFAMLAAILKSPDARNFPGVLVNQALKEVESKPGCNHIYEDVCLYMFG